MQFYDNVLHLLFINLDPIADNYASLFESNILM